MSAATCITYCDTSVMIYIQFNAVQGMDYDVVGSSSATFPAGMPGMACIDVTIIDDDDYQGEHDFTLHILSVSPMLPIVPPSYVTITITDPEGVFHVCYFVASCMKSGISSSIHINDILTI